jgi:polyhydroxybutyrate depolymerase
MFGENILLKAMTSVCLVALSAASAHAATTVYRVDIPGTHTFRRAVIHIPEDILATKTPSPVIFALHDQGSSPSSIERKSDFLARADKEGFTVVFPAGHPRSDLKGYHWNVAPFAIPDDQIPLESDTDFIDRIISHLGAQEVLDQTKIYIAGFGSGGTMAYHLACSQPHKFDAIASVGGAMTSEDCLADTPVSILHLHGMNDQHIPYLGGPAHPLGAAYTAQIDKNYIDTAWPDAMSQLRQWERRLSCGTETIKTTENGAICSFNACDSDAMIKSCLSLTAGHEWMGADLRRPGIEIPKKSKGPVFSATSTIWDFFRKAAGPRAELRNPDTEQAPLDALSDTEEVPEGQY